MVEEDKYCVDILNQVAAARAALSAFSKVVFTSHIRTCVRDGIRTGSDDVIIELIDAINTMVK
jgi:DNA-binding FrmR family transcriptional regulator